jgi:anti-sigma factor RsiW
MICPEMEERLNEYLDGTLAARDRVAVEAHLAGCAGCRAAVAELRALVIAATSLPKSITPTRDLWTGIEVRIERRATSNVRRRVWQFALAAAAVLVIALSYRLLPPSTALYHPVGAGWAAVQADYERATDELSGLFAEQRGRLHPGTVVLVERNLGVIDGAIRESRAALARDPANAELRTLFAAAERQKVELLRWAVRVAAS